MPRLPRPALAAALALLVTACFDPNYPVGLPCGPDRFCPSGQTCNIDDICEADEPADGDAGNPSGIDAGPPDAGLGELLSIDIGPDLSLALDQTHSFVVTANYENGSQVAENIFVIWASSDNGVVFVDFMGVANPQNAGVATITADYNGRVDTAEVTVTPAM